MTNVVLISSDAFQYNYINDEENVATFLHERAADGFKLERHFSTGSGTSTLFPGFTRVHSRSITGTPG